MFSLIIKLIHSIDIPFFVDVALSAYDPWNHCSQNVTMTGDISSMPKMSEWRDGELSIFEGIIKAKN